MGEKPEPPKPGWTVRVLPGDLRKASPRKVAPEAPKSQANQRPQTKLRPLEFRIYRKLEPLGLKGQRILVACSGGRDSVALVSCLAKVARRLGFEVAVASVHHGPSKAEAVTQARASAIASARTAAGALAFFELRDPGQEGELVSEESLREHRLKLLEAVREQEGFDRIAFAHHADDLFETRLIRLLRGTGAQGLRAMKLATPRKLRPFLSETRESIAEYANECGLQWCEDPTNAESGPLRNWLRHEWLPQLESKRHGSVKCLARSLESITETLARCDIGSPDERPEVRRDSVTFSRSAFMQLGITERRELLAALLRQLGVRGYGATHVEEIRKRIETRKKRVEFHLLNCDWLLNAEQILATRV